MSKAILVMDMPDSCLKCPMLNGNDDCILQSEDDNFMRDTFEELKENCPLKQMPEKANHPEFWDNGRYDKGWNDCIDEIMKGRWNR